MSQVPLAPPPQTGQPIDSWLYLLWRRLTQAGQILWGSIVPGTSADVEGVVTDATGTAGSLVFSGNPTLQGAVIDGNLGVGGSAVTKLSVYDATSSVFLLYGDAAVGQTIQRSSTDASGPSLTMKKTRGTFSSPSAVASDDIIFSIAGNAYGGSTTGTLAFIAMNVETYTADTDMSGYMRLMTRPAGAGAAAVENVRIAGNGTVTLGGVNTAPALKVTPVASQARWVEVTGATSSTNPTIGTSGGDLLICGSLLADTVASAVNYVQISGSASGAGGAFVLGRGADTDVALILSGQGASGLTLATVNGTVPQVAITHTASANRYITLTGSYGGNPKIATSGGSLDIGSAVVFTGQTVGTTVGAAGGASALPATPLGYITTSINGTACKIPYYNT